MDLDFDVYSLSFFQLGLRREQRQGSGGSQAEASRRSRNWNRIHQTFSGTQFVINLIWLLRSGISIVFKQLWKRCPFWRWIFSERWINSLEFRRFREPISPMRPNFWPIEDFILPVKYPFWSYILFSCSSELFSSRIKLIKKVQSSSW